MSVLAMNLRSSASAAAAAPAVCAGIAPVECDEDILFDVCLGCDCVLRRQLRVGNRHGKHVCKERRGEERRGEERRGGAEGAEREGREGWMDAAAANELKRQGNEQSLRVHG